MNVKWVYNSEVKGCPLVFPARELNGFLLKLEAGVYLVFVNWIRLEPTKLPWLPVSRSKIQRGTFGVGLSLHSVSKLNPLKKIWD